MFFSFFSRGPPLQSESDIFSISSWDLNWGIFRPKKNKKKRMKIFNDPWPPKNIFRLGCIFLLRWSFKLFLISAYWWERKYNRNRLKAYLYCSIAINVILCESLFIVSSVWTGLGTPREWSCRHRPCPASSSACPASPGSTSQHVT